MAGSELAGPMVAGPVLAGPVLASPVLAGSWRATSAGGRASGSAVVTEGLRLTENAGRPPGDAALVDHLGVQVEDREDAPAALALHVEHGAAGLVAQAHPGLREPLADVQHGGAIGLDLVVAAQLVPDHFGGLLGRYLAPPHLHALHFRRVPFRQALVMRPLSEL